MASISIKRLLIAILLTQFSIVQISSYCADYAQADCENICAPNSVRVACSPCTQEPPQCLCWCPSLPPSNSSFCNSTPSEYCRSFCGQSAIGFQCTGPSGYHECACFCPAADSPAAPRTGKEGTGNGTTPSSTWWL